MLIIYFGCINPTFGQQNRAASSFPDNSFSHSCINPLQSTTREPPKGGITLVQEEPCVGPRGTGGWSKRNHRMSKDTQQTRRQTNVPAKKR